MTQLRIFLADDHAVVREGLKALINAQPKMSVVGEAEDGLVACQKIPLLNPNVAVIDVSMPVLSGSQVASRLSTECPTVRVLALTVHEDKGYIRQLLAAGAAGYVLKRAAAEELIHAIRVVASGGVYLDPNLAGKVVGSFVRTTADSQLFKSNLSERELDVAKQTAAGHSNKEIAASMDLSVKTVETYRARAMEKLGLRSRAELVRYAVQEGWLQLG